MGLLLILPLLVSGYMLCNKNLLIRYRLPQYEGQLLYFCVAYFGIICFSVAFILVSVLSVAFSHQWGSLCPAVPLRWCPSWFSTDYLAFGGSLIETAYTPWKGKGQFYAFFLMVGIVTMLMPYPLSWLAQRAYKKSKEKLVGWKLSDTEVEVSILKDSLAHLPVAQVLFSSSADYRPVMVIMEDRRVYVGLVSSIGTPSEASSAEEDFGLWPLMGGYCDKDTLEIVLDSEYPEFNKDTSPQLFMRQKNVFSVAPLGKNLEDIPFPHRRSAKSTFSVPKTELTFFALGYFAPRLARLAAKVLR